MSFTVSSELESSAGFQSDRSKKPISTGWLFAIYAGISMLITYATFHALPMYDILSREFGQQMDYDRIQSILSLQKDLELLQYPIAALMLLIKTSLIALCLYVGTIFFNQNITFGTLFRYSLLAQVVFFVQGTVKLVFFMTTPDLTLETLQFFGPLSIGAFFQFTESETWLAFLLNSLNLFQLAFWFLLAYLLKDQLKRTLSRSLEFVMSTYVIGWLLWTLFITFLNLNMM